MIVSPSILSADFNNLLQDIKRVQSAQFLHIDVMDGHFVPNISFGAVVYKNLKQKVDFVFDVHLMIDNPLKYANDFINAGADYLTFHLECKDDIMEVINKIKESNIKVGISIKPNTCVSELDKYLKYLDLVLVMSVEPGFGGQKFMDSALDKIKYLSEYKKKHNLNYIIEVDGGINYENAKKCKDAGAIAVVCGTYLFKSDNPEELIKELKVL